MSHNMTDRTPIPTPEGVSETDSCPACGALPCDWVNNPHTRASSPRADGVGEAVLTSDEIKKEAGE